MILHSDRAILQIDELSNELAIYKVLIQTTTLHWSSRHGAMPSTHRLSAAVCSILLLIRIRALHWISWQRDRIIPRNTSPLFRKHMGMSISGYIQKTRIDEARDLLRQGKTCGEVACILNYTSQSCFIRQFKKQTGITPKAFINMLNIDPSIMETNEIPDKTGGHFYV